MAAKKAKPDKNTLDPVAQDEDVKPIIMPPEFIKAKIPVEPDTDTEGYIRPTIPHISYSQLAMYSRCGQQYKFRYGLGLKEKPKVSLALGKGGHTALEFNTKRKLKTGEDAPLEELLQVASDQMDHYLREMPRSEYEADVEPGHTKDKFLEATKVYRQRDAPAIKPLVAELEFNLDLNPYVPEGTELPEPLRIVNGKIDVIYNDDQFFGSPLSAPVGVEDYKFIAKKKNIEEVNLSTQLTLYSGVVKARTGKWPTKLGIRQMYQGSQAKKPDPNNGPDSIPLMREPQYMTPEALEKRMARLVYQFSQAEKGIRAGVFIPVDDPRTCSWCGYRERCQDSLVNDIQAAKLRATTTPPS